MILGRALPETRGMISDAGSLAMFYQALLHNPAGLWSDALLARATTTIENRLPDASRRGAAANRSVGCLLISGDERTRIVSRRAGIDRTARWHGGLVSDAAFGHGGIGGQIAFADPVRGISFVFLVNGLLRDVVAEDARSTAVIDALIRAVDDAF